MLPLPRTEILDEDGALDWWETEVARFYESVDAHVKGALLVRTIVADLRAIRQGSLEATLSLTDAAAETGYSAKQIGRWVKSGKIANVGIGARPRVKRADILSHKKAQTLPGRPDMCIVGSAQDIARSVVNS